MPDAFHRYDEFVAARAVNGGARVEQTIQPRRNGPKQRIARAMTERVVDRLEAIDVDEEHGDRIFVDYAALEQFWQTFLER